MSEASGCVETTGQLNGRLDHGSLATVALVSTRSARWRSRIGSTSLEGAKLVEPVRERSERLCRNHPTPSSPEPDHGRFGFDSICSLALADRLNQLGRAKLVEPVRERSERLCRNHRAVEWQAGPQVPDRGRFGFDLGCSFVAARLNQL